MDYYTESQLIMRLSKLTPHSLDPKEIPNILKEISEMLLELYRRVDKLEKQLKQTGHKDI